MNHPQPIWIISPLAIPTVYGWRSRPFVVAKALKRKGYQVAVFASKGNHYLVTGSKPHSHETHECITFHWFDGTQWNNRNPAVRFFNWWRFNSQVKTFAKQSSQKPQAIILSSPPLTVANLIQPLQKYLQAPVIFEVRDLWPMSLTALGGYNPHNPVIQWLNNLESKAYHKADQLVGIIPGFNQYIKEHFPHLKDKATYIPQSFDEGVNRSENVQIKYDIAYAGSFSHANDVLTLVKALQILQKSQVFPKVLLIGTGPKADLIAEEVKQLPNVRLIWQWLPHEETLAYLQQCRICYSGLQDLKLYTYGISPVKWLDYWMLKKPILAAYSGGLYQMLIQDFGWQVPAENAQALAGQIQNLLTFDEQTLSMKGERGYQYMIAHHHPEHVAQAYQNLIEA